MAIFQDLKVKELLKKKSFKQNYHDQICKYTHQGRQYVVSSAEKQNNQIWSWGGPKCLLVYCKISDDDSFIGDVNTVKNTQHPYIDSQTDFINKYNVKDVKNFVVYKNHRILDINFFQQQKSSTKCQKYWFANNQVVNQWVDYLKLNIGKTKQTNLINGLSPPIQTYEIDQESSREKEQMRRLKNIIQAQQKKISKDRFDHCLEMKKMSQQRDRLMNKSSQLKRINEKMVEQKKYQMQKINTSLSISVEQRNSLKIELNQSKKLCSDQAYQLLILRQALKAGGVDEIFDNVMELNNSLREQISQLKAKLLQVTANRQSSYILPIYHSQNVKNTQTKPQNRSILLLQEDQITFSTSPKKQQ